MAMGFIMAGLIIMAMIVQIVSAINPGLDRKVLILDTGA
jgi:hypothetical protein